VEPGIGHEMQINLDITVAMPCSSLHLNVQDAMQDRILAGDLLAREDVRFDDGGAHKLFHPEGGDSGAAGEQQQHVYEVLRKGGKKGGFKSGRKGGLFSSFGGGGDAGSSSSSCRIYGSMGVNKVQGDFHITAKGHGYWEDGAHIDHQCEFLLPSSLFLPSSFYGELLLGLTRMAMAKSIQLLTRNQ